MRIMQHLARVVLVVFLLLLAKTIAWAQPSNLARTSHVMAVEPLGVNMSIPIAVEVITGTLTAEPTPPPTKTPTFAPTAVATEIPTETPPATEIATVR